MDFKGALIAGGGDQSGKGQPWTNRNAVANPEINPSFHLHCE